MLKHIGIIFNNSRVRVGRLQLSGLAFRRMHEHNLTTAILEEVFRYGKRVDDVRIVFKYDTYEVGIICILDETRLFRGNLDEEKYIIITCWKGVIKHV